MNVPTSFSFPFGDSPWPIQKDFMTALFECLEDADVHDPEVGASNQPVLGIFESPTGTGKSLSLICGSMTWLRHHESKLTQSRIQSIINAKLATINFDASANEPDWVRQHMVKKIEREAREEVEGLLKEQQEREARLELLRRRKREEEAGVYGFGRVKRHREDKENKSQANDVTEVEDDNFLVDYTSDTEDTSRSVRSTSPNPSETKNDQARPAPSSVPKIYYVSRTHSQLTQFVGELKKTEFSQDAKSLSMGSRVTLCVNEKVNRFKSMARVNDACLDAQKKEHGCKFMPKSNPDLAFMDFADRAHTKVHDIEDLVELGKLTVICPYYASRTALPTSRLVTLPYPMMLNKGTRDSLGINLKGNVVIFDEAHNLMDAITNLHSVALEFQQIERAQSQLLAYFKKYKSRLSGKNIVNIKHLGIVLSALQKYMKSTQTATASSTKNARFMSPADFVHALNVDQVNLFKLLGYLEASRLSQKLQGFVEKQSSKNGPTTTPQHRDEDGPYVAKHIPSLQQVQTFLGAFLNAGLDGRIGILPSGDLATCSFKYLLLNPSDVFHEILTEARAVVLAGGTMDPLPVLQSHLLQPPSHRSSTSAAPTPTSATPKIHKFSCGHIIPPTSILTVTVTQAPNGVPLDFTYSSRNEQNTHVALLQTLNALTANVPGGVVVFCGSYAYMNAVVSKCERGTNGMVVGGKKVFVESTEANAVESCLEAYAKAVKQQGGAVLFSVVGGKMSEGINFSDDMARAVMMVGLPYPNKNSPELIERMRYVQQKANSVQPGSGSAASSEYYETLCMRALNQSIGRAIRHKNDYAAIYLLDQRFRTATTVRDKLPNWIKTAGISDPDSFDSIIQLTNQFFNKR